MASRLGQRQAAVYAAEADALGRLGIRWPRLSEAQAYLDGLVGSAWFGDRWPHFAGATVERRGSGSRWSTCEPLGPAGPDGRLVGGRILVADGGLSQPVLLHELAHLLAGPEDGHGPGFVSTHLRLVRHEMGFPAYADYSDALRVRGLDVDDASSADSSG